MQNSTLLTLGHPLSDAQLADYAGAEECTVILIIHQDGSISPILSDGCAGKVVVKQK